MEFQVLLLGNDINAYYMARNFHEEYGIKSYIIGRVPMLFTSTSEIVNVEIFPDLLDEDKFVNKLIDKAKEINSKKIILVGCNDDYVSFIIKYKEKLSKYYLFNYTNNDLLDKLVNKEMFYKNFKDSGLDFPKTYFYDTKKELLESGKYRVLRVGNFFTNDSWYYSNLELEEEKIAVRGDLLYAWSASFGPWIWEGDKTIFHYHIWNVKFNEDKLCKKYLYWFFEADKHIIKESTTGSTMIHVSMENMMPRLIPIPPLSIQHRIVEKIEEVFAAIDNLPA